MLVVDENLHSRQTMSANEIWYPGRVISVVALRPRTVIKDDAIPGLLLTLNRPTFVTINADDFWRKANPHLGYCIIAIALPKERKTDVPNLLRNVLDLPDFKTKALRMGKIVRLTDRNLAFYGLEWQVKKLTNWQ